MFGKNLSKVLHNKIQKVNIVFGIGTNSGKTHTTCKILKKLNSECKNFFVIKPILSGFDADNFKLSDNYSLLLSAGLSNPSLSDVLYLSKYVFIAPLSPDIASWGEGVDINFDDVVAFCKEKIYALSEYEGFFIETAGGVCTPCSNKHTMVNIAEALEEYKPCKILVVNEYLGAISHTLSALRMTKFDVIVFNRVSEKFALSIKNHTPYDVLIIDEKDI